MDQLIIKIVRIVFHFGGVQLVGAYARLSHVCLVQGVVLVLIPSRMHLILQRRKALQVRSTAVAITP